jgi:hypothetical protein
MISHEASIKQRYQVYQTVPMRPINFIASYPRSGNTFLRALLANHNNALGRPLTVSEIAQFGDGEVGAERWNAVLGAANSKASIEGRWSARRKYLDDVRATPGKGPVFLKTHTLNGVVFGRPSFDFMPGDRAIYIVRHPMDVVISGSKFFGITPEAMLERMLLSGAYNQAGDMIEATGSWMENVTGWLNETKIPVSLVRYRDLVLDTHGQLKLIVKFLQMPSSHKHLMRAVNYSNFQTLRSSNLKDGFYQGPSRGPTEIFFSGGEARSMEI